MFKKLILLFCIACSIQAKASMVDIKVVIPYVPGGGPDTMFRILQAQALRKGINFIPDYRPGANGLIGAEYVTRQKPDGKTIMFTALTDMFQKNSAKKIDYSDLEPIAAVCSAHMYLVANNSLKADSFSELVNLLKVNPQAASLVASTLTQDDIYARSFGHYGIKKEDLMVVSFNMPKGIAALIGGHVDVGLWPAVLVNPYIESGKVKVLAAYKRNDAIDRGRKIEVMNELANFNRYDGYGIFMPKGADRAVVQRVTAMVDEIKNDNETQQAYLKGGCTMYNKPGNKDIQEIIKFNTASSEIDLTYRQQQIAKLIVERGLTNQQIADALKITEGTVKLHTGIVLKKFNVRNRTQLALAMTKFG